jgi:hypothetical protein
MTRGALLCRQAVATDRNTRTIKTISGISRTIITNHGGASMIMIARMSVIVGLAIEKIESGTVTKLGLYGKS